MIIYPSYLVLYNLCNWNSVIK